MRSGSGVVVVLAAGRGTRMGGPKALMVVAGEAWWRTQARRIEATGRRALWVASPEVAAAIGRCAGATALADPDAPMMTSVLAGLAAIPALPGPAAHACFILPVDVPCASRAVFDAIETEAMACGVAVPRYAGTRGHPIAMSLAWARAHVRSDTVRLDELTAAFRREVGVNDADVVCNLNTPQRLREYEERLAARG